MSIPEVDASSGVFPYVKTNDTTEIYRGITYREWVSAQVMAALMSQCHPQCQAWGHDSAAKYAVECADALITELNRRAK